MIWQDYVIAICTIGFSYALIPQILLHFRMKRVELTWQTIIITTVCIFVVMICMFSLKLWFTTVMNFLVMMLWMTFGVQKWIYRKMI